MNVLSLFDGISCGQVALKRAGIKIDKYYSSEIDKYAIQITQKNFPNTIQLGDITQWRNWEIDWSSIDLVIGGSPCQDLSCAGKMAGLTGERSKLFFEFIEILGHCKRFNKKVLFLLENNESMSSDNKEKMSDYIACDSIKINSNLVSAQNRARLYWTNINGGGIPLPQDKNIKLSDILTNDRDWRKCGSWVYSKWGDKMKIDTLYKLSAPKSNTLTTSKSHNRNYYLSEDKNQYTNLNIIEWERLQTLPDNYTEGIPNTQRYKCVGNAWTVDVIAHIFRHIKWEKL